MSHISARWRWFALCVVSVTAGCTKPPAPEPGADDTTAVREVFTSFQKALKDAHAEKIWDLLDADSRDDADRAAKGLRDKYAKASGDEKKAQEKDLGLSADELGKLTGKTFLKSKRFLGKYHEVHDSKFDKASVQGDKATVNYVEEDGDKEKFNLVREGGKWKLIVPMPK
jgi:hypothetical protein